MAVAARIAFHEHRSTVNNDCKGDQLKVVQGGLVRRASVAKQAQKTARSGPAAKMEEYFKSSSSETRQTVSDVFGEVAGECNVNGSTKTTFSCIDTFRACSDRTTGYTLQVQAATVFCPTYFSRLSAVNEQCHSYDQGTIAIHEATHLHAVKSTSGFAGYGYDYVRILPGRKSSITLIHILSLPMLSA